MSPQISESEGYVLSLVLCVALGYWIGRRTERNILFRIISAQRTNQAQEQ